jgi:hypothetical protein
MELNAEEKRWAAENLTELEQAIGRVSRRKPQRCKIGGASRVPVILVLHVLFSSEEPNFEHVSTKTEGLHCLLV